MRILAVSEADSNRRLDLLQLGSCLLAGIIVCMSVGFFDLPLLLDNQIYFYIAERAASGVAPHISQFDPKNALSMFASALAIKAGRAVGADDLYAMRALSVAVTILCYPLLWLVTRRLGASRTAAQLSIVLLSCFTGFSLLGAMGSRPKVLLVALILLTLLAAADRRSFALGVLATCCFLTWQPALIMLGAAFVTAAVSHDRRRELFRVALGALLAWGAYESYFLVHGALGEQLYQSLVFPAQYAKPRPGLLPALRRVLGWSTQFSLPDLVINVFVVCIAGAWTAVLLAGRSSRAYLAEHRGSFYFLLCAPAAFAFLLIDYQGYPDRFFVMPFAIVSVAVLAVWPLCRLVPAFDDSPRAVLASTAISLLAVLVLLRVLPAPRTSFPLSVQRMAARAVGEMLDDGKSVYAIGCPHLLAMNRSDNHTRFGFFPWRVREHFIRLYGVCGFEPLNRDRWPDVVLVSRHDFDLNRAWLKLRYRRVDREIFLRQAIRVWELKDSLSGPSATSRFKLGGG